jgi:hypothetical protein
MKTVVIYPGRFQPMLAHHAQVYNQLTAEFPNADVYIGTSDKVSTPKSPFNFKEKQQIAAAHGVPTDRILQANRPYHKDDYAKYFDEQNTIIIFALGEKDMNRFPFSNVNSKTGLDMTVRGEDRPKYYQKINTMAADPQPMSERGYITLAPTIKVDGAVASASAFRDSLSNAADKETAKKVFIKHFGKYDESIFNMIYSKITDLNLSESYLQDGDKYGDWTIDIDVHSDEDKNSYTVGLTRRVGDNTQMIYLPKIKMNKEEIDQFLSTENPIVMIMNAKTRSVNQIKFNELTEQTISIMKKLAGLPISNTRFETELIRGVKKAKSIKERRHTMKDKNFNPTPPNRTNILEESINRLKKLSGIEVSRSVDEAAPIEFTNTADPKTAKFLPPSAASSKMSIANRFPAGEDVNDFKIKQDQFIKALMKTPESLLSEINERLDPKDENSLAVSQKLNDILELMYSKNVGITALPADIRQFVLSLTVNAVKNMMLVAGDTDTEYDDDDEVIKDSVNLSHILSAYNAEAANPSDQVKQVLAQVGTSDVDIYQVLVKPRNPAEQQASEIIQSMYDDAVIDFGLHPDDDVDEILDRVQDELERKYSAQEAVNPYAVGTAQAMKSTGDKPPLKKSTIKKAHRIAKAVAEDQEPKVDIEKHIRDFFAHAKKNDPLMVRQQSPGLYPFGEDPVTYEQCDITHSTKSDFGFFKEFCKELIDEFGAKRVSHGRGGIEINDNGKLHRLWDTFGTAYSSIHYKIYKISPSRANESEEADTGDIVTKTVVGHVDSEADMLRKELYKIGKYAVELHKMLGAMPEGDLPHWWQAKIVKAGENISAAKHYLDAELNQPIDEDLTDFLPNNRKVRIEKYKTAPYHYKNLMKQHAENINEYVEAAVQHYNKSQDPNNPNSAADLKTAEKFMRKARSEIEYAKLFGKGETELMLIAAGAVMSKIPLSDRIKDTINDIKSDLEIELEEPVSNMKSYFNRIKALLNKTPK